MVLKQNGKTGRVADIDSHNPLERSSFHTGEATLSAEQLAEKQALEQAGGSSKQKSKLLLILAAMGPGIVTAMAGNDAGGISTYSTVGAQFGFATLWVIPIMCVLLIVVEMTAAKMGAVTGKGFAALIRESFGIRLTALAMLALLIGNVCTTFSEFAGIASGMEMFGVSKYIAVPVAAIAVWLLIVGGSYKRVEKVFLILSLVFLTYVIAAFLAQPNWENAAINTIVPHVVYQQSFVSLVISMIGTTIAPWMMFFNQSNVVEKGIKPDELFTQKVDVVSGTVAACLVAWFIIVTTGTVLYPQGIVISDRRCGCCAGPVRGQIRRGLVRHRPDRSIVLGRMRASADHGVRHLRGIRLGSRRLLQVEGSAAVQEHLHVRHRVLGRHRAHPEHRPHGRHAHGPVHQRPGAAGAAGVHGADLVG